MQIQHLSNLAISDLISRYNKIVSHGVEFPTEHQQHITKHLLSDTFEKGQTSRWASGLKCFTLGDGAPEWDIRKPEFAGCLPANKEECEAAKFKDTYHSTAFCPAFMKMMTKVVQGGSAALFIKACQHALQSINDESGCQGVEGSDEETTDSWLSAEILEPVRKVLKGFLALLSPVPMLGGSKVTDVRYLFPDDGKTSLLVRRAGKYGRQIQSKVRESNFFKTKKDAYNKKAGIEAQLGQPLLDLHMQVEAAAAQDAVPDATPASYDDFYVSFAENATMWQQSFRKGCTLELQTNLLKLMRQDVKLFGSAGKSDLEKIRLLYNALCLFSLPDADQLRQEVSGLLHEWQGAASKSSILKAAQNINTNEVDHALVEAMLAALKGSEEAQLGAEDAPHILQAVFAVMVWATEAESRSSWPLLVKLWQHVIDAQCSWLPEPQQKLGIDLCKQCVRLFGGCVAVQNTVAQWDALEPAKKNVDNFDFVATGAILPKLLDDVLQAKQSTKEKHDPPEAVTVSGEAAVKQWESAVRSVGAFTIVLVDEDVHEIVTIYTKALKVKVQTALHYLQQVCKGSNGGKHWYERFKGDLLAHFEATLKKADTKQIISLRDAMKQVPFTMLRGPYS